LTNYSENIYQLEHNDIPQATEVLYNAFENDPVFNAIFEGSRPEQRKALFETPLRYCMKFGQVWAPSKALEGIAGWVRGELAEMSPWRMLVSGAIWSGFKMGPEYSQKLAKVFKPIEEARQIHMGDQPFLYLFYLGVASEHQGQGYGRVLLDELINVAENDQLAVYLETETEENVQLYNHFGFEVIEKVDLPVINLPMWKMVRKLD
jgi:ribosomal protein S18 acetylase RimI-like enzyme